MKKKSSLHFMIILIAVSAITVFLLIKIDRKVSNDTPREHNVSVSKGIAKAERECIAIEFQQLQSMVSSLRAKNSEFKEVGDPVYSQQSSTTNISLNVTPAGKRALLRDSEPNGRWKNYFTGTQLVLPTEVIGNDTVVQCPAFIMVRIFQLSEYEKFNP